MNAILKMSAFIFPLITFPYVSRILGASGNGKVAFAESIVSYFAIFSQLGIPTYGIKKCAECRENKEELNQTVQELLLLNIVTMFVTYIALFILVMSVPRLAESRVLIFISSASILLNACGMDWLFQALEQYTYITFRNLGFKIVSIILMFALIHSPKDYVVLCAINVVGNYGSNILNFLYARRFLSFKKRKKYQIRRHIKPILIFFLLSVSITIYTSLDSVMLGFLSSTAEIGFFAAATKMKTILTSAVSSVGTVMLPRMSAYVSQGKVEDFRIMISKSLNLIFLLTVPLCLYFFIMSDATIDFLAGAGYVAAVIPMRILSFTVFFIGVTNVLGLQVLVPTGREKWTAVSTLIGAFVDFIVNLFLIPKLGAIGAAWATFAAEFSVLIFQIFILRDELKNFFIGIKFFRILAAGLLSFFALSVFIRFFSDLNSFYRLLISAPFFFILYGLLLLIFKEPFTRIYLVQNSVKLLKHKN